MLAIMKINASQFEPYLSLGLLVAKRKNHSLNNLCKEIEKSILTNRPSSEQGSPSKVCKVDKFEEAGVVGLGFIYSVKEVPSWFGTKTDPSSGKPLTKSMFLGKSHHLVLILKLNKAFAVFTSYSSDWGRIRKGIEQGHIKNVRLASPSQLNGAFTHADWPMPTVWMKGLHRSIDTKADSKQLSGPNIRAAIDPFGDQTYSFSSGRSIVDAQSKSESIGLSPAKGRIWLNQSSSFEDFCDRAAWVMGLILNATELATPITALAQPLSSTDSLMIPYEISWVPQDERASWSPQVTDAFDKLEGTSFQLDTSNSKIVPSQAGRKLSVKVEVLEDGAVVSVVTLEISYGNSKNSVLISVIPTSLVGEDDSWESAMETIFADEKWGKLRYLDGYVVSNGVAYHPQYSAKPFTSWSWADFSHPTNVDVTKEKPTKKNADSKRSTDLGRIGDSSDDSIFTWVYERWGKQRKGLLICDDGSGEIADFLHLAPEDADGHSVLTLVHAKASSSSKPTRELSVSNYEVVVGQAVKNLAYASPSSIVEKFNKYSKNAKVWTDGMLAGDAKKFAKELESRRDSVQLRIVVVQPQTLKQTYFPVSQKMTGIQQARHAQLSALLLQAEASCRNVGAVFSVVGSM